MKWLTRSLFSFLCSLTLSTCSSSGHRSHEVGDSTLYASYRKDYFYGRDRYREPDSLPLPVDGGRMHVVGVSSGSGEVKQVMIDGKAVEPTENGDYDWVHVYPMSLAPGQAFWLSFHSQDKKWDSLKTAQLQLLNSSHSVMVKGSFTWAPSDYNITYITCEKDMRTLLVHVRNGEDSTKTISKVIINGVNMTNQVSNPSTSLTVQPHSANLLVVKLPTAQRPGDLITAVLQYAESGTAPSAAGVRLTKPHFPIEAWPKSDECPFPTVKDDNFEWHKAHGIDTLFFGESPGKKCGSDVDGVEMISTLAPKYGFYGLLDTSVDLDKCSNLSMALGVLLGDESDDKISNAQRLMTETDDLWKKHQSIMTYVGGSRSLRNGIFSGTTDIQGMDMYIAACAPHVQRWGTPPPIRGSYDYMRLVRQNHMPLVAWTYGQAFDDGWDAKIGSKVISHRQPDPAEYRIQAMSVVAACSKGLMYFQSEIEENKYYPETWKEMANFNKDLRALAEYVRTSDCTDMVKNSDGSTGSEHVHSISQALRSQQAILVPVINLKNNGGYSDLACELGRNEHWDIEDHTVDSILVTIPSDFGPVVDKFEVRNGAIYNLLHVNESSLKSLHSIHQEEHQHKHLCHPVFGKCHCGHCHLPVAHTFDFASVNEFAGMGALQSTSINNIAMSASQSTRMFVLANSQDVRKDVQNRLKEAYGY